MRLVKRQLEPRIRTRRLLLRPIGRTDLGDIVAGIGDFAVSRMLARVPHPYGMADAEDHFALARRNAVRGASFYLVIECNGRVVGNMGVGVMPYVCEFGYWVARSHWGQGLATEAAAAVLGYAFDVLGLRLVRSGVFADNPRSFRVQEKLGFRRIGTSERLSLARGSKVEHIDTVLTPARFRETVR